MEKRIDAVVVLSGGQDSATCLFWAIACWGAQHVEAISFDYGQRHLSEIAAASEIAAHAGVEHQVVNLKGLRVAASALTSPQIDVKADGGLNNLPSTFTPCRNLVFLGTAAARAISIGARRLVTGVCQTDYSGYPDCRRDFVDAMEVAIRLGNGLEDFSINTPLMELSKAETVKMAQRLAKDLPDLDVMRALGRTVTCYHGQRPGCGTCPACVLRAKGFAEAGIADPAGR